MDAFKHFFANRLSNFVPAWLILVKDVTIVVLSFISSYTLRYNFQLSDDVLKGMYFQLIIVAISTLIVLLFLKLHKGIVRHTGLTDILLIVKAILIITSTLITYNILLSVVSLHSLPVIPTSVLIIFLLLSMMVLVFVRFSIRLFYYWLKSGHNNTMVMIYGAGAAGLMTKNVLNSDNEGAIKIVGFIDDHTGKIGKTIEGTKVYAPHQITDEFLGVNNVKEIILAINNIGKSRKREIIEMFLLHKHIKVKEIPPVQDWMNGNLAITEIKPVKITDLLQRNEIVLKNGHVRSQIRNKRILVTGAAGSIGSELCRQISRFNPELLLMIDQGETPLYYLENEIRELVNKRSVNAILPCPKEIAFFICNLSDEQRMKALFEMYEPDIIYHAAAYKHVAAMEQNPYAAVGVNLLGTKIIADLSREYGVEKFVLISTDKAVNPVSVMGATKRAAEIYIQSLNNAIALDTRSSKIYKNKTEFIITRFGNVLGSNGSVIPLFEKQIASGGPVTVTHHDITRYFMTIPEACKLVLEAGALGKDGEILLFDMGEPVKISDLAEKMIRLSGLEPNIDIEIRYTGLRPGEKMFEKSMHEAELGIRTHHPKIFIAKEQPYNYKIVNEHINEIIHCFNSQHDNSAENEMLLLNALKRMVPDYAYSIH